jgi:hypothetical protein
MTTRQDILRAASLVIANHGERAWFRCAQRADELLDRGDVEAARAWRRILAAVEELQSTERPDGATAH